MTWVSFGIRRARSVGISCVAGLVGISVLYESDLYTDWVPSWTRPRIGVRTTKQLETRGRANQLFQITVDVPWPFATREVIMNTIVVDEIDTNGYFCVRIHNADDHDKAPPVEEGIKRVDFKGLMLFRPHISESTSSESQTP